MKNLKNINARRQEFFNYTKAIIGAVILAILLTTLIILWTIFETPRSPVNYKAPVLERVIK